MWRLKIANRQEWTAKTSNVTCRAAKHETWSAPENPKGHPKHCMFSRECTTDQRCIVSRLTLAKLPLAISYLRSLWVSFMILFKMFSPYKYNKTLSRLARTHFSVSCFTSHLDWFIVFLRLVWSARVIILFYKAKFENHSKVESRNQQLIVRFLFDLEKWFPPQDR